MIRSAVIVQFFVVSHFFVSAELVVTGLVTDDRFVLSWLSRMLCYEGSNSVLCYAG